MAKTIKTLGVSPITDTIYLGRVNPETNMWVGEKEDFTEQAIKAVFEMMMNKLKNCEKDGQNCVEVKIDGIPFVLRMERIKDEDSGRI